MAAVLAASGLSKEAAAELKRFWGGLVAAAGKPCYRSELKTVTHKHPKRLRSKETHVLGFTRKLEKVGDEWIETSGVEVARWEAALGVAGALVLLTQTNRGQGALASAKSRVGWNPQSYSLPFGSSSGGSGLQLSGYNGILPGPTGWGLIKW